MLRHIFGLGLLGAIGFTMSLFISALSFGENPTLLEIAKQSVIVGAIFLGAITSIAAQTSFYCRRNRRLG